MKKIIFLGVITITLFSLAGCATTTNSDSNVKSNRSSQVDGEDINKNASSPQPDKKTDNSTLLDLEVPTTLTADNEGKVIVSGRSTPNAKVKIGLGILGGTETADKDGKFELTVKLDNDEKEKIVEVTSKLGNNKASKKILIKQNPEIIQSQTFNVKNFIKLYKDTKNSDTMTMIGKPENGTKNLDVPILKINYTIKDKNKAMMYAQSDAKSYFKSIVSKVSSPTSEFTPITIYFNYNFGNADKSMFGVIINKSTFLKLKQNNGDFTALDKNAYFIEPEFANL